jgi:hypothetical protein
VPASANGDFKPETASEIDCINNVSRPKTPRDYRRALIDQAVVHFSGIVITAVLWSQQLAAKNLAQVIDGLRQSEAGCHGTCLLRRRKAIKLAD